jgi:hypothetical protein
LTTFPEGNSPVGADNCKGLAFLTRLLPPLVFRLSERLKLASFATLDFIIFQSSASTIAGLVGVVRALRAAGHTYFSPIFFPKKRAMFSGCPPDREIQSVRETELLADFLERLLPSISE